MNTGGITAKKKMQHVSIGLLILHRKRRINKKTHIHLSDPCFKFKNNLGRINQEIKWATYVDCPWSGKRRERGRFSKCDSFTCDLGNMLIFPVQK